MAGGSRGDRPKGTELAKALRELHLAAGSPTLDDLRRQAATSRQVLSLSGSTLSNWRMGTSVPRNWASLAPVLRLLEQRARQRHLEGGLRPSGWWEKTYRLARAEKDAGRGQSLNSSPAEEASLNPERFALPDPAVQKRSEDAAFRSIELFGEIRRCYIDWPDRSKLLIIHDLDRHETDLTLRFRELEACLEWIVDEDVARRLRDVELLLRYGALYRHEIGSVFDLAPRPL